ncbi:polyribonucleotide 5'-hydroxyl-kinase [Nematocida sp. AWRm77]|nr:polyribonucleotide 5'-hydroxyl-kinase [Nematocida sp. AWRm77]
MDIELKAGSELRIEVPPHSKVKFVVEENTAEENGQELLTGKWYTVKDELFFIFTYSGCRIKLATNDAFFYTSEESTMPYIFNVFNYLWHTQKKKVLIVGEGRNTLANILSNYFIRKEESVLYIDLDIHSSSILFPGTMASCVIEEVFSHTESLHVTDKLCYYYGSQTGTDNTDLHTLLLEEILSASKKKNFAGPTVLTGDKNVTISQIESVMSLYPVDYLLIIGNEKMFHQISRANKIYIPRFPGLIPRDPERQRVQVSSKIKNYFYGDQGEYSPQTLTLKIRTDEFQKEEAFLHRVVQIGDEYMAPMSALPLGSSKRKNSTAVTDIPAVERSVLAVSSAERIEDVPTAPVIGFLLILEVVSESEIKVLCPQCKCPSKEFLIQGKVRLLE